MSKFLQDNCYYVLRNNKITQVEFKDVSENEIFLFNGVTSSITNDYLIVFGFKRTGKTNILETYHDNNTTTFRLARISEKKIKELTETYVL